jgi:hypothetical protein
MRRKEHEREMRRLHGELVALQEWVKASGARHGYEEPPIVANRILAPF